MEPVPHGSRSSKKDEALARGPRHNFVHSYDTRFSRQIYASLGEVGWRTVLDYKPTANRINTKRGWGFARIWIGRLGLGGLGLGGLGLEGVELEGLGFGEPGF